MAHVPVRDGDDGGSGMQVTMDSNTLRWRRGLLALCAIGFILWAFSLFADGAWRGGLRLSASPTSVPFHDVVRVVRPGSTAAKAGIKRGDIFNLRVASAPDRWRFRSDTFLAGVPYTYVVLSGATERRVTLQPHRSPTQLTSWSWFVGALGALIFAAIIAWRRPWLVEARMLCLLLITTVLGVFLAPYIWITPMAGLDFGATIVGQAILDLSVLVLIAYTLLFGRPISTLRKAIAAFAILILGFDLLFTVIQYAGVWSGAFDLAAGPLGKSVLLNFGEPLAVAALPLFAIAAAVAVARGRERSLLVWTTAMPFLNYLIEVLSLVAWNVPALASNESSLQAALIYIGNGAQFLTPFAIGYALLNRRLLDIGFVINQAAVFSGVSIIVVGLFMLGEWVLGSWFGRVSHTTNVAITTALVLGLGFSVRAIHTRVDRVLDRLFFRKRHEDEMAIRTFAENASAATDAGALVRRAKETLETHAGAEFVTVAMDDGTGRYGDVSERDAAIVALQDRHTALDLASVSTQLRGEFAYPMIARGKLVGALVLGPKRSGESYAPDESRAIMQLAREVGSALHVLRLAKLLQEHHLPA